MIASLRAPLALLVLALWLGGATVVAVSVAPAAFAVLPSRALAGALVGRVLPHLFIVGMIAGVVAAALAWTDRGSAHGLARTIAALGTVAACAIAQLVIAPRIARLREAIGPSIEALQPSDPMRAEFGRLHGLSVLAMGFGMVAAGIAIVLTLLAMRTRG